MIDTLPVTMHSLDQSRSFVDMRVSRQHQVDPSRFQDRHGHFPHLDQAALAVLDSVRPVRPEAIRRMMEKCDDPHAIGLSQIRFQPFHHRTRRVDGISARIERDEMDRTVIEGVIRFGSTGNATALTRSRQQIRLEIRARLVDAGRTLHLVISRCRPASDG